MSIGLITVKKQYEWLPYVMSGILSCSGASLDEESIFYCPE